MKRLNFLFVVGVVLFFLPLTNQAQVNVQIIHNSPDPAADSVDIYLDGAATPAIENLKFREATAFLPIPATTSTIGVAPGNSTSVNDTVANFNVSLMNGQNYIIVANGVINTAGYNTTLYSATEIAFNLEIFAPAQLTASAGTNELLVFHGSSDAPSVDALANGAATPLIDNLDYATFQGYASVISDEYVIQITPFNDNSTIVESYYVDLAPLAGNPIVVVASGFLDPATNNNGPEFGIFAYSPLGGPAIALPTLGSADVQVIHNSAEIAADTVDVYINTLVDTIKIDNFAFRNASGFVSLPTGYELDIRIAGRTSTDYGDQEIATFPATLMDGETYAVIANGVLDPAQYAANPDAQSTAFTLFVEDGVRQAAATAGNLELKVFHGSTDAPSVGVNANGNAVVPSATYGDFTDYLSVAPAEYRIDVTGANAPGTLVAPFYLDGSGFADVATIVFASGFLDPSTNQNGEAFGLYYVTAAGGEATPVNPVGNARAQVIHNSADPIADTVDVYINTLADTIKIDNFAFRNASGFVDLPSGYELDIRISDRSSTGYGDQEVATFPATVMSDETYGIIANGVVQGGFAANPDGEDIAFNLFVTDGVREAAANAGDLDLRVFHGSTDAPSVGVNANGNAVVPTATYGDFTDYLSVAPAEYRIDVTGANAPGTLVAPFYLDGSGFADVASFVFASGFLDPSANNNGPAFGLFYTTPAGGEAQPVAAVGEAEIQVIHNSADLAAATVDVYINTLADTIKVDDFDFREGTGFVALPSGYPLDIRVALPTSTNYGDGEVETFEAALENGEAYHVIANGLVDATNYVQPTGRDVSFQLYIQQGARKVGVNSGQTDVRIFHGSTDAPAVDVIVNADPATQLTTNLDYGQFEDYQSLDPLSYELGVGANPVTSANQVVGTFQADLTTLTGGAGIVIASGFLDPTQNENGEGFGLFLFLQDALEVGIELPSVVSLDDLQLEQNMLSIFPNPASSVLNIAYDLDNQGEAAFSMYDMNGRVVWESREEMNPGSYTRQLDLNGFAEGTYTLVMMIENQFSYEQVVITK